MRRATVLKVIKVVDQYVGVQMLEQALFLVQGLVTVGF